MDFETAVPVAAGATGRVVRVYDPARGEDIALKLLHRDDPIWVQRMLREAQVQQRLVHPRICQVYGTGMHGAQPYIAMRLVEGETLDRAAESLSDRDKAALLAEVADAIAHAHEQGVVHRDLKPGNILVEREQGRLQPVVVDFGLVRDVEAPELTRTGQLLGTPGYMAPEQATAAARVDGRADVFSLGVILFELFAGRRPFVGESAAEVLLHTLRSDPPSLQSLRPDIDPALVRIVRQCLEGDPAWRYASAAALRDDLRAFADGRRVAARADSALRRTRRFARRHPWRAGLGGLAAVLCVAVVGLAIHGATYARAQSLAAQRYMEFANRVENAMRFAAMKPAHDVAPERARLQARVEAFAAGLPTTGPAAQRTGQLALGRALAAIGRRVAARTHLLRAIEAGDDSPALHAALGRLLMREYFDAVRAVAAIANAELREAEIARMDKELREPARSHLQRAVAAHGDSAEALQDGALLNWLDGEAGLAREQLLEAARNLDYPVDALALVGDLEVVEALALGLAGETAEALARWRAALQRYEVAANMARSHAGVAASACRVGGALVTVMRHGGAVQPAEYEVALQHCERAIALDSGSAEAYASHAQAQADLGLLVRNQGEWRDAGFQPAVDAARRALALDPESVQARRALGALLTQRAYWQVEHDVAESVTVAREAIALLEDAQRADSGSAHGAMMLANAHGAAARATLFGKTPAERDAMPHRLAAEAALRDALSANPAAPLVLEVHLIDKLTWRGFDTYMAGGDPIAIFDEALSRGRALIARAPDHPSVGPVLAMAAWTAAEYQGLIGGDATALATVAVETYRAVLARGDAGVATRFNAIGALQALGRLRLEAGATAAAEIVEAERWIENLRQDAEDGELAMQLASQGLLRALEAVRAGHDPRAEFARTRGWLKQVYESPIDAREAHFALAELAHAEHAWRATNQAAAPQLLAADLERLQTATHTFSDYPALHLQVARWLASLPPDSDRRRRAQALAGRALLAMPALSHGNASLLAELGIGAGAASAQAATPPSAY